MEQDAHKVAYVPEEMAGLCRLYLRNEAGHRRIEK
jgi:hypothetical protein